MPLLAIGTIASLFAANLVRDLGHAVALLVAVLLIASEPYGSIAVTYRVMDVRNRIIIARLILALQMNVGMVANWSMARKIAVVVISVVILP